MPTPALHASSRPNIMLVVLDSVRADRLSCYGGPSGLTPNLDGLAGAGVRFARAVAESTWTLPMAHTLFTGLTPREHRAERHRRAPEGLPTLPVLLREAGYATFCSTANTFIHRHFRLDRGFDTFRFPTEQRRLVRWLRRNLAQPLGLADHGGGSVVQHFRQWLPTARRPWFATLWLNDAHYPYLARLGGTEAARRLGPARRFELAGRMRRPASWTLTATPADYADLRTAYDDGLAYVDRLVGRVAEELSAGSLAAETYLILLADHGDMLGEHGLLGHGSLAGVYHPLVHVPLIVRGPGVSPGVSSALVQAADATETVAAIAGVSQRLARSAAERLDLRVAAPGLGRSAAICEREPLSGRRLQREQARTRGFNFAPHLSELTAVYGGGYKLISRSTGQHELYHLDSDPHETADLAATQPEERRRLQEAIADFQYRAVPHVATLGLGVDDARIVDQRLRDLGYL